MCIIPYTPPPEKQQKKKKKKKKKNHFTVPGCCAIEDIHPKLILN